MGKPGYREFSRVTARLPLGYRILFRALFPFWGWRALPLSVFVPSLVVAILVVVLIVSLISPFLGSRDRVSDSLPISVSTPVYSVSSTYPAPLVLSPVVPTPDPGHCTVWCYPGVDCNKLASLNPRCTIVVVGDK